ncbi:fibronectin type III domain-containing protein [Sorangium sp. So ce693]|uniref:fibronectin type III domain-containing protein n=1 Tax=Sorangium sp. So ce693 TaxID=3133318 RepID=UPI003F627A4C
MRQRRILAHLWLPLFCLPACVSFDSPDSVEAIASQQAALSGTDLTPTSTADVSDMWGNLPGDEGIDKVHDGDIDTKLYMPRRKDWIQYRMQAPSIIVSYDITSANDYPDRDPRDWTFEGSYDGLTWHVLDTRTNESFTSRHQTRSFTFSNSNAYLYYRLNVSDNFSDDDDYNELQLAELRVGGSVAAGTMPGTPALGAPSVSSSAVTLTWAPAANATGYYVQRVNDDGSGTTEFFTSSTSYTDTNLASGTGYLYQVQAVNGALRGFPSAVSARATTAGVAALQDITALSSSVPVEQHPGNEVTGEEVTKVTDNNPFSKYYEPSSSTWIRLATPSSVVQSYSLTSANDFPVRDPKDWTLEGSNDGTSWTVLDTRTNQSFTNRHSTRTYACNPEHLEFSHYRLHIQANHNDVSTQLAEWRLFGTSSASLAAPAAPGNLNAQVLSGNQIRLTWTDNAGQLNPETSYRVERATNSSFTSGLVIGTTGAGSTEFRATALAPSQTYYFRVSALNAAGSSSTVGPVNATTTANTPPLSFVENGWYGGQNRTVTRTYSDAHIATYFDQYVPNPTGVTWVNPIISEAWAYAKDTYGSMVDPILYVIGNQDDAPGDEGSDAYDAAGVVYASSDEASYRNIIFTNTEDWSVPDYGWALQSLIHEMGHIVESNNNGIAGSPAFNAWGDSKWADIFGYDVHLHLTTTPSNMASQFYEEMLLKTDDYGVHWFRDWLYPLYAGEFGNTAADHKGSRFLAGFFELLAEHLPTINSRYGGRPLNLGEYIHFCSGAAGVDLEDEARLAFRWTPRLELELARAQSEFPGVSALYLGNRAPGFTFDPITRSATVNVALSGQTLAGTAADPDLGDTLTYAKQSGASWLTVASDGTLSGTPPTGGLSTAVVRVTDQNGLFDTAELVFDVTGGTCTPESDAQLCARLGASCGSVNDVDNCGAPRSVSSCGSCTAPETCGGGGTPNVCGGSGGSAPCSGLCSSPVVFSTQSYPSGNLGTAATCHETLASLQGLNCGNFAAGRTFRINGVLVTCNGANVTLPATRNGGYCMQASAGNEPWAYFATF